MDKLLEELGILILHTLNLYLLLLICVTIEFERLLFLIMSTISYIYIELVIFLHNEESQYQIPSSAHL